MSIITLLGKIDKTSRGEVVCLLNSRCGRNIDSGKFKNRIYVGKVLGRQAAMKWMQFLTPVAGMGAEEARAYMRDHKEGSYTLLDVRQPSEYEKGRIPGAKLIPLPELAGRLGEIDPRKPVIAY
jgi:hypothetical protein